MDLRAFQSRLELDVFPRGILQQLLIRFETRRVSLDEPPIDGVGIRIGRFQQMLRHTSHKGHVAGDSGLDVERPNLGRVEQHHARDLVRDDGASRRRFDERVHVHDLRASAICLRQ